MMLMMYHEKYNLELFLFMNQVTKAVIEIANNLVDLTEEAKFDNCNAASGARHYTDILLGIEQQVSRSTLSGQKVTTVEPNIALTITTVMPNRNAGFSFAVLGSGGEDFIERGIGTYNDPKEIPVDIRASVSLPSAMFDTPGSGKYHCTIRKCVLAVKLAQWIRCSLWVRMLS